MINLKTFIFIFIITLPLSSTSLQKGKNSIIDTTNNLVWQDTKDNITLIFTHEQSAQYCNKLRLNNYSNWRLPTVQEYKTVLDLNREDEIKLNKKFYFVVKDDYWTNDRTWLRNFGKYGYYIMIKSGHAYYQNRTYKKYVRCVKDLSTSN